MGFSRQEYWNGLSFPSPGDLSNPRIKPESLALADKFFTAEPPGLPVCFSNLAVQRAECRLRKLTDNLNLTPC